VGKAKQAGALYGGKSPGWVFRTPLRLVLSAIVRSREVKGERGPERGRCSFWRNVQRERLEGPKAQGSLRPRPRLIAWGAKRGARLF
jgi:hypothetical protein